MTDRTVKAWAIAPADGGIIIPYVASTRTEVITATINNCGGRWQYWYRRGYRAVRVEIGIIGDGE
jgi:hypothetical protein